MNSAIKAVVQRLKPISNIIMIRVNNFCNRDVMDISQVLQNKKEEEKLHNIIFRKKENESIDCFKCNPVYF